MILIRTRAHAQLVYAHTGATPEVFLDAGNAINRLNQLKNEWGENLPFIKEELIQETKEMSHG